MNGEERTHVEIIVNTKHLLRWWTMNSLDQNSRFTRAFCQFDGKLYSILYCRGRSSHSSLSIPAVYGTICAKTKCFFFFAWFFVSLVTEHDILPKFSQEPVLMFSGCIGINWLWKLAIINPTTTFTVMKTPKSVPSAFRFTYSHKWFKSFATQWEGKKKKKSHLPMCEQKTLHYALIEKKSNQCTIFTKIYCVDELTRWLYNKPASLMLWSVTQHLRLDISTVLNNTVKKTTTEKQCLPLCTISVQSFYNEIIGYGGKSPLKVVLVWGTFPVIFKLSNYHFLAHFFPQLPTKTVHRYQYYSGTWKAQYSWR